MSVKRNIITDYSHDELIEYLNTPDFFQDMIDVIEPEKYELFTNTDLERNRVTWPVKILYQDVPSVPFLENIVPHLNIEQTWNNVDSKVTVNITSNFFGGKLFEIEFTCIIRYLSDLEIEGKWIEKQFYVPDVILDYILDQFEEILKIILKKN